MCSSDLFPSHDIKSHGFSPYLPALAALLAALDAALLAAAAALVSAERALYVP